MAANGLWPRSCGVNGAATPIGYKNPSPNSICSQFSPLLQNPIHISNIRPIRLFSRLADLTAARWGHSCSVATVRQRFSCRNWQQSKARMQEMKEKELRFSGNGDAINHVCKVFVNGFGFSG
ncbi:hypothetical protein CASFOL_000186 [Castilleja foliolosa]|uniref:Uncharacterized protein n=1 Tax=Castilleja foliolosa TaxID=1961234 RepID=A0ABD3ENK3_9LAMI